MSEQWRVACHECGSETSELLRMHSRVGKDEDGEIVVECNNCGTERLVDVDNTVTDGGSGTTGSGATQEGVDGWSK